MQLAHSVNLDICLEGSLWDAYRNSLAPAPNGSGAAATELEYRPGAHGARRVNSA
jgi:hypothetical protein